MLSVWTSRYITFARSSCRTLLLTFSARLQVKVIIPESWLASPSISCKLGLRETFVKTWEIKQTKKYLDSQTVLHFERAGK